MVLTRESDSLLAIRPAVSRGSKLYSRLVHSPPNNDTLMGQRFRIGCQVRDRIHPPGDVR